MQAFISTINEFEAGPPVDGPHLDKGTNLVEDGHKFDKISISSDYLFTRNCKLFVFSTNYL